MRTTRVVASLLLFGCVSTKEPVPASTPTGVDPAPAAAATEEAAPTASAEAPAQPPGDPPAEGGRVREGLGPERVAMITAATEVLAGRMKVIAARQAEEQRLASASTISGYPIDGELRALEGDVRARVVATILDEASYQWDLARRCKNDYFVGLRFAGGGASLEFALGMPCEQGWFVFRSGDAIDTVGAVMTSDAARIVVDAAKRR